MILKSINLGGWLSQSQLNYEYIDTFIIEKDFFNIKSWGFNSVRIPFDSYLIIKETGKYSFMENARGIDYLKKAVSWAEKYNLICILDFHIASWHYFLDGFNEKEIPFFSDPLMLEKHSKVLEICLSDFKRNNSVYIELLNEPATKDHLLLNQFYNQTMTFLRNKGFENTFIVESSDLGRCHSLDNLKEFASDKKIIPSFHFYHPLEFTHQKAFWINADLGKSLSYPADDPLVTIELLKKELEPAFEFKETYGCDLYCGEFGVYLEADHESRLNWISDVMSLLYNMGIGWALWTYKNIDFGVIDSEYKFWDLKEYNNPERVDIQLVELLKKSLL